MQVTVNKDGLKYLLIVIVILGGFVLYSRTDSYKRLNYPPEYVKVNEQNQLGPFNIKYISYELNPENHPKNRSLKKGRQLIQGEFIIENLSSETQTLDVDYLQISVDGVYYKCYFDLNNFDVYADIKSGEARQIKVYSYIPKDFNYSFFVFAYSYYHDQPSFIYFAVKE